MQNTLHLPTKLELTHFHNLPNQIKLFSSQSTTHQQNPSNPWTQNIQPLIKSYIPIQTNQFYPILFIKSYLLIKINSLSKKQCKINHHFLQHLVCLYNRYDNFNINVSYTQAEIFSQIIQLIDQQLTITSQQFLNIIQGNALFATNAVYFLIKSQKYIKKQQFAFVLSFVSLGGRQIAFTPIVHRQKNHAGQIYFAKRINQLFYLNKKPSKQQSKVQDPYSMRCSPQVHGIAYDCFWQLKNTINILLNKPHHKYLYINNKNIANLLLQSDTFSLKIDYLICCLQEIGAISYLRSQRILNTYLGKNKLKQHSQYKYHNLLNMLKTCVNYTSKNKILCEMTNFDTCNIQNYNKDIFYGHGGYYKKINQLFDNLYYIMAVEVLSSLEALRQICNGDYQQISFINKQMEENFGYLRKQVSVDDKNKALKIIKEKWNI